MTNRPLTTLAQRLYMARTKRGLSQVQLAETSGLKQSDISKLENGRMFKTTGMARLARALRVPDLWLELGEGEQPEWGGETGAPQQPIAVSGNDAALDDLERQIVQAYRRLSAHARALDRDLHQLDPELREQAFVAARSAIESVRDAGQAFGEPLTPIGPRKRRTAVKKQA